LEFYETYNWMYGAPTMKSDAMLAKFIELGGKYVVVARTSERAAIKVVFEGAEHSFEITWEESANEPFTKDRNGKTKTNYATPRKRMQSLWARVVSDAVHTVCPQACKGNYPAEEVETFINDEGPSSRTLTPDEVQSRVRVVDGTATERPAQAAPTPAPFVEQDCTIIPEGFGEFSGRRWAECDDETLAAALESDALDTGYKAAVRVVVEARIRKDARGEAFFNDK
jgi:hypothetical protein